MGMLDGKYYVIYLNGGLEGVTEDRGKLLPLLRDDYLEFTESANGAPPKEQPEEFDLNIKFDTFTLTWRGAELRAWYAVNVQGL
jgi:hypothetical protein